MFSEGNINHAGIFLIVFKKKKGKPESIWEKNVCQPQPLWIWSENAKYFPPREVHSGFVAGVAVSAGLLGVSE